MSRNKTTLVGTGGGSKSLRTTVPSWIVEQFGLKSGKKLFWRLETGENGELYIKVKPEG
tara:strand:- start:114 stop:290 length:177 start_codon:yes stop_codon:yes gene_type:complete